MSDWAVPLTDVRLPRDAMAASTAVLERGWLSMGPEVAAFEDEFARFVGSEHAVACSSGTAALLLALAGSGVGEGDEVIMPSLTFVACANIARTLGAVPVFADVEGPDALTLDPESVAAAIGPRTRAIVPMHYGGRPASPELAEMARERGIALIEDAAHAPGSSHEGPGPCGSWGLAGCFSFFSNKNLPLGEGGMLTTSSAELAGRARKLRSHGMTTTTWDRRASADADYDVELVGWNLRMDEPRAAMGRVLLDLLELNNGQRERAVATYRELLAPVEGVRVANARPFEGTSAHHLMVVLLDPGVDRAAVAQEMAGRGVQTSVHYRPIHTFSAYAGPGLDRTDELWPRLITLPLYPRIKHGQIELVVESLTRALDTALPAAATRPAS